MAIKSFAFFGIMVAIFATATANADPNPAKRIASTHYVDEAVAPKQNQLKDGSGANANNMNAVVKQTVAAGTQADPTSNQALVSETAVRNAVGNAVSNVLYNEAVGGGSLDISDKAPTVKVVDSALHDHRLMLDDKEDTLNKRQLGNNEGWNDISSADKTSNDKYPSMKTMTSALDTKEDVVNKKALGSNTWAQVTDKDSDTKYPSMKVLNAAVTAAQNAATFDGEYTSMNNTLPEINGTQNFDFDDDCTDENPCILTKVTGGFVWTHMQTQ